MPAGKRTSRSVRKDARSLDQAQQLVEGTGASGVSRSRGVVQAPLESPGTAETVVFVDKGARRGKKRVVSNVGAEDAAAVVVGPVLVDSPPATRSDEDVGLVAPFTQARGGSGGSFSSETLSSVGEVDEVSDTGLSIASTEPYHVVDRKRRADSDGREGTPSKVSVRDLTLLAVGTPAEPVHERRVSGRNRRPTSRSLRARVASPVSLVRRLDAIESDDRSSMSDAGSDVSYKPVVSRKRARPASGALPLEGNRVARGRPKNRISVTPEPRDQGVVVSEIELRLGPISETDEDLPSPSTIFESRPRKGLGPASPSSAAQAPPPKLDVGRSGVAATVRYSDGGSVDVRLRDAPPVATRRPSGTVGAAPGQSETVERGQGVVAGPSAVFLGGVSVSDDGESWDEDEDMGDSSPVGARDRLLDDDKVHPELLGLYADLTWINGLRRSKFIGYSTADTSFDDFSPASYGGLLETVPPRVRSKLVRSMAFVQYGDVKNIVRVPLTGFVRAWECIRIPRGEGARNAVFVTTGVSLRSYVSQGREVGQSYVKQLHVRPLENDWEILQCNVGTFFNDSQLHAPGRRSALVFQTKRQGWSPRQFDRDADKLASTPYSSPSKGGTSKAVGSLDADGSLAPVADVAQVNILEAGAPPYRLFDEGGEQIPFCWLRLSVADCKQFLCTMAALGLA
ncbi:hypothetical protein VNI00_007764 [Paramarasmius palmivorus]|uniref:Uncharacterized protein n=1 Tax=Paramarasmius palmivorus TaxID=297713 RepID=A0AAW0CVA7_9AGAR